MTDQAFATWIAAAKTKFAANPAPASNGGQQVASVAEAPR